VQILDDHIEIWPIPTSMDGHEPGTVADQMGLHP
jgi:hypothetical protein